MKQTFEPDVITYYNVNNVSNKVEKVFVTDSGSFIEFDKNIYFIKEELRKAEIDGIYTALFFSPQLVRDSLWKIYGFVPSTKPNTTYKLAPIGKNDKPKDYYYNAQSGDKHSIKPDTKGYNCFYYYKNQKNQK